MLLFIITNKGKEGVERNRNNVIYYFEACYKVSV